MSRVLIIGAVVAFAVALFLVLVGGVDHKFIDELTLAGLTCFAGAHAV
jgi:hypothetical protein